MGLIVWQVIGSWWKLKKLNPVEGSRCLDMCPWELCFVSLSIPCCHEVSSFAPSCTLCHDVLSHYKFTMMGSNCHGLIPLRPGAKTIFYPLFFSGILSQGQKAV
jgi:hypothetical protein